MRKKVDLFLKALENSKDITKDDVWRIAEEYGLSVPKRMAKSKIIDIIASEYLERLYEAFSEFIYIPVWEVAGFYGLTTEKINKLQELGVIKEHPKVEEFYNRSYKEYYNANTYPLSVLDYNTENLDEAYNLAYGGHGYRLRVETKTTEEIEPIVTELKKVFDIAKAPDIYPHRNNDGYYSYLSIKQINNSNFKHNAYKLKINDLEDDIVKLKEKHKAEIEKIKSKVAEHLGIEFNGYADIIKFKREYEELKKQISETNESIEKNNNSKVQKIKNERGAGRKALFSDEDKRQVKLYREKGKTIKQISQLYCCSVGLIHKIINENN